MAAHAKDRKNRRDNFSEHALKILCRRAGGKCCKCGVQTIGPLANNPYQALSIGQGAHIAAAAPGGPRYNSRMSSEQRSSVTNGLWLCSNCHDQVDKDVHTYSTARLIQMKREHEQRVRKEVGTPGRPISESSQSAMVVGISSATILDIRKTKFQFLESLGGRVSPTHQASVALSQLGYIDVEEDDYSEEVGWELVLLFHQLVSHSRDPAINLEVVRRIKSITDSFQNHLDRDKVQLVCTVMKMVLSDVTLSRRCNVYQSGMALLKDLIVCLKSGSEGLHNLPQQLMRQIRSTDDTDMGPATESRMKRRKLGAEPEEVESEEESEYARLMDELVETKDLEKIIVLEQKIEDLGYAPYVQ